MSRAFLIVKSILRVAKLLAGCLYLGLAVFLLYIAVKREIPITLDLAATIQLVVLAYIAFYFARWPGRPLENDRVALILVLTLVGVALVFIPQLLSPSQEDSEAQTEAVFAILLQASTLIPLFVHLCRIKTLHSRNLAAGCFDYLVLRSFVFDVVKSRNTSTLVTIRYWLAGIVMWIPFIGEQSFAYLGYSFRFGWTYESLLRKALGIRPHIAATVHNPAWRAISPVEGTLIKVRRGQEWKEVVRAALGVAPWVIALPGVSDGLKEELKIIRYEGLSANQFLVLIPETSGTELSNEYASTLKDVGFDLAPGLLRPGSLYAFSPDWIASEVASGIDTEQEAAYEILAWCKFKDRPDAQWCEFDRNLAQPTPLGRCPNCGLILDSRRLDAIWRGMGGSVGGFQFVEPLDVGSTARSDSAFPQ